MVGVSDLRLGFSDVAFAITGLGFAVRLRPEGAFPSSSSAIFVAFLYNDACLAPGSSLGGARAKASVRDQMTGISLEGFPGAIFG